VFLVAGLLLATWQGVVSVEGMIREPGGFHPYRATITLHLLEGDRLPIRGGFRVPLASNDSTNEVQTSVHQTEGLMLCSGAGKETLPSRVVGYVETRAGQSTYHLAVPRAFGAFACGEDQKIKRDRVVVIGAGDAEPAEIETADPRTREVGKEGSLMEGAFVATKTRGPVSYDYKVTWSLVRQ